MQSGVQSGSSAQVQQTAHWTAVIGAVAISVCLTIGMVAMAAVVWRDGNTTLVSNAMAGIIQLGGGFAIVLGAVVGGPQVVSVLLGRFGNGMLAVSSPTDASAPAPAVVPAVAPVAAPSVATVTISAATPQAISVAPPVEQMTQQKASE